jgi:hypothetical protein
MNPDQPSSTPAIRQTRRILLRAVRAWLRTEKDVVSALDEFLEAKADGDFGPSLHHETAEEVARVIENEATRDGPPAIVRRLRRIQRRRQAYREALFDLVGTLADARWTEERGLP